MAAISGGGSYTLTVLPANLGTVSLTVPADRADLADRMLEEHEEILRFTDELVQEAAKSGMFAFPPITDVRIDQAKTDIVIDRDGVGRLVHHVDPALEMHGSRLAACHLVAREEES